MSDKNFTMYVTGGTNVFVPVLSDDPKQVSRVLDSLKRCYGDDDSEEVKAALSFVSDYLDDLTAEDDKKDSDGNAEKETMNGVVMAVVPGKEPRLMAEDEFYKNHTDYDERVQILCASYQGHARVQPQESADFGRRKNIWLATLPSMGMIRRSMRFI